MPLTPIPPDTAAKIVVGLIVLLIIITTIQRIREIQRREIERQLALQIEQEKKRKDLQRRARALLNQTNAVAAHKFLKIRQSPNPQNKRQYIVSTMDSPGIYILHNKARNKYYVGQSINVAKRSVTHFNGKGSPDVYRDFRQGQLFTVQFVLLENAPRELNTLNRLERYFIAELNAYTRGYNKTRGNGDKQRSTRKY